MFILRVFNCVEYNVYVGVWYIYVYCVLGLWLLWGVGCCVYCGAYVGGGDFVV